MGHGWVSDSIQSYDPLNFALIGFVKMKKAEESACKEWK
jgi:hypothetical protein